MELNKDVVRRDEILFGTYDPSAYRLGGLRYFNAGQDIIKKLVDEGFADPNERQNNSPSIEEFLEYTDGHEGVVFGGYAVSAERNDYRVTIERIDIQTDNADTLVKFVNIFRYADEFDIDHVDGTYSIRAWWD